MAPRRSGSLSNTNAVAQALAHAQTIAKEKRHEYRWALGLLGGDPHQQQEQQQQQQQEPAAPATAAVEPPPPPPPPPPEDGFNAEEDDDASNNNCSTSNKSTNLSAARPSERLSRRLALAVNPGWVARARPPRSAAAEAFSAPGADDDGLLLLRLQRAADAGVSRAMAAAAAREGQASGGGDRAGQGEGEAGQQEGDGAAAVAFHRKRDAHTAYVESAARARLVARGGHTPNAKRDDA